MMSRTTPRKDAPRNDDARGYEGYFDGPPHGYEPRIRVRASLRLGGIVRVGVVLLIAGTGARCRSPADLGQYVSCPSALREGAHPRRGTERLSLALETLSYSRLTAADEEGTDYR
jgi:hypothetical protein